MRTELFFRGNVPTLNKLTRMHFAVYARYLKTYTLEARSQMVPPNRKHTNPVTVHLIRMGKRAVDVDNLAGSAKLLFDSIRAVGLIPDDNPAIVTRLTTEQIKALHASQERTILIIADVEPEPPTDQPFF